MRSPLLQTLARPAALRPLALGVAALAVAALGLLFPGLPTRIEERGSDPLWQLAAHRNPATERRVVIVDIDEDSLAHGGAWPWPRERIAALSDALQQQGARVQLMDIVFPEARQGDSE